MSGTVAMDRANVDEQKLPTLKIKYSRLEACQQPIMEKVSDLHPIAFDQQVFRYTFAI